MNARKQLKMGNLGINVEAVEHVEDNEDNYGDNIINVSIILVNIRPGFNPKQQMSHRTTIR